MRIFERTRREIAIAPRVTTVDALGAQIEGFSTAHTVARANLFPASGGLERREAGLADGQPLEMTLPAGTQIAPGDGVCIGADAPNWRCIEVQNWPGHCAARLERIAGDSGGSDAESAEVLPLSPDNAKTGMERSEAPRIAELRESSRQAASSEGGAQLPLAGATGCEAAPSEGGTQTPLAGELDNEAAPSGKGAEA
ncbi:MAG TPA: hypothetical protein IAB50_01260 [Candidatus Faecivicinus avistercoris]|nr:hypothetical protein [Candidatus Faecivicinus avistercoris]